MLHFFRQIRRKLLSGNQFQKYLFYAIGEVVLVVIGILIALQINNWNELQQQRKNAVELYKNISAQLVQDRENIQGQILYNRRHMPSFQYAIELIGSDNMSEKDSLSGISGMLADYSDFDREGNIYTRLVNSGDVKLLKNEEINNRLRALEETYIYVNRMENIHYDAIMQMIPELTRTVNISSNEILDEDMLFSGTFQNLFALALRIMREKDGVYQRALEEIDILLELIEEETK